MADDVQMCNNKKLTKHISAFNWNERVRNNRLILFFLKSEFNFNMIFLINNYLILGLGLENSNLI